MVNKLDQNYRELEIKENTSIKLFFINQGPISPRIGAAILST